MSQLPLFTPPTEWVMPDGYPDLSSYEEVAIDLETCDPNLKTMGAGWARKDGYVVGVAVAVATGSWYFPFAHENGPNLDKRRTLSWLQDQLKIDRTYIFHNAMYDVGWLWAEGVEVGGRIVDTMVAAPLLDENRFNYSLNAIGREYLNSIKSEQLLREAASAYGVDAKAEMWRLPPHFVGEYAEKDAELALQLWQHFKVLLRQEELEEIFNLETDLFPVIFEMRKRGVRIDVDHAHMLKEEFDAEEQDILFGLKKQVGFDIDIWAAATIAKAFDKLGLSYPRTEKTGQPSFTKGFLDHHSHPFAQDVVRAREINKVKGTFIDAFLKHEKNGRIHAELHPLRNGEGGTVTGRFSYSNPNLQQIPSRNGELAPKIRGLFLPEEGEVWGSFDYSSQEPRIVVHYASLLGLAGANAFIEAYENNPCTDFHQLAAEIVGVGRKEVKDINLGLFYGMGKNKLASTLGMTLEEAIPVFDRYHTRVPFVRQLSYKVTDRAEDYGRIRTLLGRKCRFDLWEPKTFGVHKPLPYEEAKKEYGPGIKRAFTYKALNRLIQGSAADQTKKAMIELWREKICPMVQVHDELAFSISNAKQAELIKEVMETCVEMNVPSVVDAELGPNWGQAKQTIEEVFDVRENEPKKDCA